RVVSRCNRPAGSWIGIASSRPHESTEVHHHLTAAGNGTTGDEAVSVHGIVSTRPGPAGFRAVAGIRLCRLRVLPRMPFMETMKDYCQHRLLIVGAASKLRAFDRRAAMPEATDFALLEHTSTRRV